MPTPLRLLLPRLFGAGLLLGIATLRADDSLEHARRAQALLGHDTWSQVIRIENSARESRYPAIVYALVFELAGLLWFYTDADGTQSFSLHTNRLEEERADFAPLLRDIDPGFTRWSVLTAASPATTEASEAALPNGCFIESVAALRARLALGAAAPNARLVSYYVRTQGGIKGHTVLAFETRDGVQVVDPTQAGRTFSVPRSKAKDPLALARAIDRSRVVNARELPLPPAATTLMAASASPRTPRPPELAHASSALALP